MSAPPEDVELSGHLTDQLRVVRKHRWLILGAFLATVFTGAVWTFLQTPVYQATATVMIDPDFPKVLNIQEVGAGTTLTEDYYFTQYEIVRSRPVLEKALESPGLRSRLTGAGGRDAQGALARGLIVEPKRNTRLVYVRFEHGDRALAAEAANALATAYVKHNLDLKLKGAKDALVWLTEEAERLSAKVRESSLALQNYRVKAGILGIEEQRKITAQKIMDFNKAYLDAQAQRLSLESKLRELTRMVSEKAEGQSLFTVVDNPLIPKLRGEISELQGQRSKLLQTYKEKHPEVLKVDAQIQQASQKLAAELGASLRALQTERRVAKAREETLLGTVNQLRREGQEFSEKEIEYLNLQRENDSNQQLYEAVLKRLKETGLTGGLETNNVHVIEDASVPTTPVKPRRAQNLLMSVLVGLALSVGLAFASEYFDRTMKTPEEIERHLGLPVIATVPVFGRKP